MAMKTPKQREEERRQDKLAAIEHQIKAGTLTVRKMTAKERKAHPPRPRPEKGPGRRRRRG